MELSETNQPPQLLLRAATAADQSIIKRMVRGAHLNPMGLNWQRFTMAVTAENEIVGCIQLKPHRKDVLELASLVVSKGWRRKGISRLLIDHLKSTAGPPLWLMCNSKLAPFYQPFGFRRVYLGQPMPTYFRWTLRLTFVLNRLSPQGVQLAIMVWDN